MLIDIADTNTFELFIHFVFYGLKGHIKGNDFISAYLIKLAMFYGYFMQNINATFDQNHSYTFELSIYFVFQFNIYLIGISCKI